MVNGIMLVLNSVAPSVTGTISVVLIEVEPTFTLIAVVQLVVTVCVPSTTVVFLTKVVVTYWLLMIVLCIGKNSSSLLYMGAATVLLDSDWFLLSL